MLRKIPFAMFGLAGLLFLLLVLAFIFGGGEAQKAAQEGENETEQVAKKEEADSPPERWQNLDKSDEMQQERKDLIRDLEEKGVIDRVETAGKIVEIYVGPIWDKIKFDKKEDFTNAVVTYYYAQDPEMSMAVLKDPYTDKEVGSFNRYGLSIK